MTGYLLNGRGVATPFREDSDRIPITAGVEIHTRHLFFTPFATKPNNDGNTLLELGIETMAVVDDCCSRVSPSYLDTVCFHANNWKLFNEQLNILQHPYRSF